MVIPLEDEVAMMAENSSPLVSTGPEQPENGVVDFNISTYHRARKLLDGGASAQDIAAATGVCLSRCERFVAESEAARQKPPVVTLETKGDEHSNAD